MRRHERAHGSTATLDTLAVAKQLKAAGFSDAQAEAVSRVVREAQGVDLTQLATKADLALTRSDLKQDISDLRSELLKWGIGAIGLQAVGIITAVVATLRLGVR